MLPKSMKKLLLIILLIMGCDNNATAPTDCFGIANGLAIIDDCGSCVGGTTNLSFNFLKDECGVCGGDGATCEETMAGNYTATTYQFYDNPECLDWHHTDPSTKSKCVSEIRGSSWKQLEEKKAEWSKCDVLCATCHRIESRRMRLARN